MLGNLTLSRCPMPGRAGPPGTILSLRAAGSPTLARDDIKKIVDAHLNGYRVPPIVLEYALSQLSALLARETGN